MDRLIYLSMAGAKATMQRQDVLSHNLANAATPWLSRRDAGLSRGAGARRRRQHAGLRAGIHARLQRCAGRGADHRARNWTWRCAGNAWLAVQALDGTEAYTRAGALESPAKARWSRAAACRCWATAARSRCRPTRTSTSPPTAASAPRSATARRWWAGSSWSRPRRRCSAATTACSAPRKATCRPTHTRAARRGARGLQRVAGRDHGGDDRRRAPVRAADEVLQTAEQRGAGRRPSCSRMSSSEWRPTVRTARQRTGAERCRPQAQASYLPLAGLKNARRVEAHARARMMIRALWIAKTGMEGQQTKLDAISHNLANVATNGYKRERRWSSRT
jgi:hypothetical protein